MTVDQRDDGKKRVWGRRRLLQAGAAAAPALFTLRARPANAQGGGYYQYGTAPSPPEPAPPPGAVQQEQPLFEPSGYEIFPGGDV